MADRRMRTGDLSRTAATIRACTRCRLYAHRTHAVPGEGPVDAALFLIGEAPGRSEDAVGRPFVGAAGKVLDAALRAVGIPRESVFITNVVKCRPPDNRPPRYDEVGACRPYLLGQIFMVQPKAVVTLGATALQAVVGPRAELREARSEVSFLGRIPFVPTYHPAAILRRRGLEAALRSDLRKALLLARSGRGIRSGPPRPGRPTQAVRSSGAVVLRRDRRVLLLRRGGEGTWGFPKGKIEPGESSEEAAIREVLEETGLSVRLLGPLAEVRYAYYWPPRRRNYDKRVTYYLANPVSGRLRAESGFDEVRWVSRREAMTLLSWPNDKDVVGKAFDAIPSKRASGGTLGPSRGARRSARRRG